MDQSRNSPRWEKERRKSGEEGGNGDEVFPADKARRALGGFIAMELRECLSLCLSVWLPAHHHQYPFCVDDNPAFYARAHPLQILDIGCRVEWGDLLKECFISIWEKVAVFHSS